MKESSTVCTHCNRPFGHAETKLFFDEMRVCKNCYVILTHKMHTAPNMKEIRPYAWLRLPALLTALIGVTGLLITKAGLFSTLLRFMHKPPMATCYGIIVGAAVLYGISLIRTQGRNRDMNAPTSPVPQSWRNM